MVRTLRARLIIGVVCVACSACSGGTDDPTPAVTAGIGGGSGGGGSPPPTGGATSVDAGTPKPTCQLPLSGATGDHGLVTLYESLDLMGGIALANGHVYFRESGHIKRVPISGGAVEDFGDLSADRLLVAGTDLVYTSGSGISPTWKILIAPIADLAAGTPLAEDLELPGSIVTDGVQVFWANENSPGIYKVPLAGGAIETLSTTASTDGLVLIGSTLYWPDYSTNHIMSLPVAGGTATQHVPIFYGGDATGDEGAIYWADGSEGTVNRWKVAETTVEKLYSTSNLSDRPDQLTVANGTVYFTQGFVGASVWRMVDGTPAEQLACGFDGPDGIAVDATSIYIASDSGVHRLDR